MIDPAKVASVVRDLVRTESINPDLVAGGSGEAAIARYVADFMRAAGLEVQLQEVGGGRWNAVGLLRGRGGGKRLMLNGHLDTVGINGMVDPFSARVEDGKLYGRGAQDMKGGLGAAILAAATLANGSTLEGDLIVAAVADEEYKSLGTRSLITKVSADAAIVTEPTGLEVVTAHKGFAWADVETRGRAAHGSRPEEGLDAIALMGRVLREIERLENALNEGPGHALLGRGSVHASVISGGQELSSYPGRCSLSLERRLVPGETAHTFEAELREIISRLSAEDAQFQADGAIGYSAQALETPRDCPIVRTLSEAARSVLGNAKLGVQSFWTDAALLGQAGIESVLFGPGGAGLHSTVEYVRLEDVRLCAETLVECARLFCGT